MDKETIKKLYLLQVKEDGITDNSYAHLDEREKSLLEKINGRHFLKTENRKLITVVMTGGAFDILHLGHIYTLTEAKKHGDVLVVSIARDALIKAKKGKLVHSQEYRARMAESLKPVDLAILGIASPQETYKRVNPEVIVYGYDQKPFLKPAGVKIVQLHEHFEEEKFKTSRIIKELGL